MRKLKLNGEHAAVLKHLYFGFLQGGNNLTKEKKDRVTVRLEARIQDKFEKIMEDDSSDQSLPWKLKGGGGVLELTPEEYQHVDKCLDAVAWPTNGIKLVSQMFDVWGDAEKI